MSKANKCNSWYDRSNPNLTKSDIIDAKLKRAGLFFDEILQAGFFEEHVRL